MEQRWAERIDTRVPTRMMTSDGRIVGAVIRNISMGGFFIETAQSLYPYTCVDVCVRVPDESGWCTHKVPAVVTHTRDGGAGLMFSALDLQMCSALNRLTAGEKRNSLRFEGLQSVSESGSRASPH